MHHFRSLTSTLSIFSLFWAYVISAQPWPGPGEGPQNLRAFPSSDKCRLEVVFERDDTIYDYSVYGLFDDSNGPIKLHPFEMQNGSNLPITVINGDHTDDHGVYQQLVSDVRYTPLIVNVCAPDVQHGTFQNQVFIRANPGGQGGTDTWESDHVIITNEIIPSPGIVLTTVSVEKNLVLDAKPDSDLQYTVYFGWSVSGYNANDILGFWTLMAYKGSGKHFVNSLFWPLKDQYGGPENGGGYTNFALPYNFDFDNDQHFVAAISVQTGPGAFSDPVSCPQLNFTVPKENPQTS